MPPVVLGLWLGYGALYSVLSLLRHFTYHGQIDLSYYLREIWGLGHGHYDLPLVQSPCVLGLHLEPILLPLSLLSRLGVPLPPLLLILQAAAVGLLSWPAYRLGQRHLGPRGGLIAAAAALLFPTVTVATLHDFHPVTLALAPLLGVIDALDEGRPRRALWLGALALLCREDIALQLAGVALVFAAQGRDPRQRRGAVLLALGLLAYFGVYVLLLQPRWLPPSGSYGLHFRAAAARSGKDVVVFALRHPLQLAGLLCTWDRVMYPVVLLGAVGFLPLLRPAYLIGAVPIAAINLLSEFPRVRTLEAHYATALVPFLLGPAVLGAGALRRRWAGRGPGLLAAPAGLLLLSCAVSHYQHGGSPLSLRSSRFSWALFRKSPRHEQIRAAVAAVPPGASVAARPGPLSHLCERPRSISPPEYDDGDPVDIRLTVSAE